MGRAKVGGHHISRLALRYRYGYLLECLVPSKNSDASDTDQYDPIQARCPSDHFNMPPAETADTWKGQWTDLPEVQAPLSGTISK